MRYRRGVAMFLLVSTISISGCGMFRNMMGSGNAKENAVAALVATTRSAFFAMTLAGIAYDSGGFGEPGSPRAEKTWENIAEQSLALNSALNGWSEAIKANKDASAYVALVAQALAVLTAILPPRGAGGGGMALLSPELLYPSRLAFPDFAHPLSFRHAHGGV